MVKEEWIPKELAEDYGIKYDIINEQNGRVRINDPDSQKKLDRYYADCKKSDAWIEKHCMQD